MKKYFLTLSLLALAAAGQTSTSDPEARDRELFRTFGYCYGQQRSLDQIKRDFPKLKTDVFLAEVAFNVTFGKSCEAVSARFSDNLKNQLIQKFNEALAPTPISEATAIAFLKRIHERAKGDIETPVKETLLAFNPDFEKSPGLEFTRGFTRTYSTLDHAKAKGVHLEIKVPMSWISREGNRPNIVQFFNGKYGREDPAMVIGIYNFTPPKGVRATQKDLESLFLGNNLNRFVPDGAKLIESKTITLEGQKGGMWVYETVGERLDLKFVLRTMNFSTFYNGKLISIEFSVGGPMEDREVWTARFEKNRTLFMLVANSLVIMNKYK